MNRMDGYGGVALRVGSTTLSIAGTSAVRFTTNNVHHIEPALIPHITMREVVQEGVCMYWLCSQMLRKLQVLALYIRRFHHLDSIVHIHP